MAAFPSSTVKPLADGSSAVQTCDTFDNIPNPLPVSFNAATSTEIYNETLATAGTEYSVALNSSVKKLMIRGRGNSTLQFTFTSGESGSKYITIEPGAVWFVDNILLSSATIYIQANANSTVVEIMEWT